MMNFHHLKYFQDAAATGSLARSAALNRVSPSAVSQAIRMLEVALGVELVNHARRRLELTDTGRRLAELSPEVFAAVQRVREELRDPALPPAGTLALGITHSVATSLLGPSLAAFSARYPGVLLRVETGPTERLKEQLRAGAIELAVFVDDEQSRGLVTRALHTGRFVLVAAPGRRTRAERPFLISEPRPEVVQFLASYRRRFGRDAGVFMQVESWEIIANLAAAGLGIGFVPDYLLRGGLRSRLTVKDLRLPPIGYELCVAYAANRPPGRNARLFLDGLP